MKMNKIWLRLILLVIVVAGIGVAMMYRDHLNPEALQQWVDQYGAMGPVVFMLIYTIATIFFLPGSVVTLAGGAMFGPVWGTLFNLTGAGIGATLAFLIARYLAGDWVEQKSAGKLKQLKHGVETEGWRFVAFVRLVPLFPFNLLNYALGLTKIRLSHYVLASYLFMLPGAIAYTYIGYVGREAIAGGEGLIQKGLLALALLAVVAFIPRFIGKLRSKPMLNTPDLKQKLDAGDDVLLLDVRTATDFVGEKGHIAEANNIPLEELQSRNDEISNYLERPVAIICTTDRRSKKAAQVLTTHGFADVHVVKGGMTDWNQNGYPVE
ncbi:MAG: VTT domain-containing protein [Gammaproteobacteria bacterium]|nr:VTT domain-containing protein [Gammaproteobacteria bacterium]